MLIRTALTRLLFAALMFPASHAVAQSVACSEVTQAAATPAAESYQHGKYEEAERLYRQELAQRSDDQDLTAGLVHTLLHENRISDAWNLAEKASADAPQSATLLTALAEAQLRKGQPWVAAQTLDAAAAVDPCYARAHLIRGRIFRIDSKYASERAELQSAYQIAPNDPDIKRAWTHTVNPANDILRIEASLATTHDLDPETGERVRASANGMMSLLSENSQTCQTSPLANPMTLPLIPAYETVKQASAYKLEVQFTKSRARLIVDTAASGLYISRTLANANGFEHTEGAPPNTVHVDSLRLGSLEFRNCMVGVSETPFADGVEGYLGTDIFAPYLLTLNFPEAKLDLMPLPPLPKNRTDDLPGDRFTAPELQGYSPVYHKNQYLLAPVLLNKKDSRLFVLDSGIRLSTMTSEVAHSISNTRVNFTNPVQTVSGATLHIYRDSFDLQFANLSLDRRDHILEFDPSAIEQNAGMEVAGMLGFDILHSLVMHIDYRDGLVKFDSAAAGSMERASVTSSNTVPLPGQAARDAACDQYANQNEGRPLNSAIRAGIIDPLDSGHLKPGQPIRVKVVREWITQSCALNVGTTLYGHVLSAAAAKKAGASELAVVFDHGDCTGHPQQELSLRVIALRDSTAVSAVHNVIPNKLTGGARAISDTSASMGTAFDDDMKAGAVVVHPGTVSDIPRLQLIPEGGPQCSAKLVSQEPSVHLGTGTEFILTMQAQP